VWERNETLLFPQNFIDFFKRFNKVWLTKQHHEVRSSVHKMCQMCAEKKSLQLGKEQESRKGKHFFRPEYGFLFTRVPEHAKRGSLRGHAVAIRLIRKEDFQGRPGGRTNQIDGDFKAAKRIDFCPLAAE